MAASLATQAASYDLQASFMELMDDYLSGRLTPEEYIVARQRFFQERFSAGIRAGAAPDQVSRGVDTAPARASMPVTGTAADSMGT